jgi:hypothetical protein
MPDLDNHYTLLDLDVMASASDIRLALERLSRRADALVYTSPEESRALWKRIRQIRADLLSGRSAREAYDLTVVGQRDTTLLHEEGRLPVVELLPVPVPVASTTIQEDATSRAVMRWAPVVGVVAVLLALVLALSALEGGNKKTAVRSAALVLTNSGQHAGSGYVSGQMVTLSWSSLSGAGVYRLQIATTPADPSDRIVFRRPWRTIVTSHTAYSLRVVGAQLYYWRVQALVKGRWTPYTHSRHFLVERPAVPSPVALGGSSRSQVAAQRVRLCWSRVSGAVAYRVQIAGMESRRTRSSCISLQLYPGTYRWTVAALVQGVRLYAGKPSRPTILTVSAPSQARLVAVRQPARTATNASTAMPESYPRPTVAPRHASGRVARKTTGPTGARPLRARVVAVRVAAPRSLSSLARPPAVQKTAVVRRRGAGRRRAGPAKATVGHARPRRRSRLHRSPRHHGPAQAAGRVPPPPPAPPAATIPTHVAAAPAQAAPPVAVVPATPTAGAYISYAYPSPTLGRAPAVAVRTSGPVAPAPSSPSYPRQPIAPTPVGAVAGSPRPPAAVPTTAEPSRGPSEQDGGRGRGAEHGGLGDGQGDRGDHPGNGHQRRGPHP